MTSKKPLNVAHFSFFLTSVDLPSEGPWVQRAREIKATKHIDNELDRKFQLAQSEIKDLILQLKLKEKSLEEANVKIKLLDSRMGNVKKQSDRISTLEKQISEAKARETQFEEAIENLNGDLRNAESEVGKWRKAAKEGKVGTPAQNERNESIVGGPRVEEIRLTEQVSLTFSNFLLIIGRNVTKCFAVLTTGKFTDSITWSYLRYMVKYPAYSIVKGRHSPSYCRWQKSCALVGFP